jgi:hypothetical protein
MRLRGHTDCTGSRYQRETEEKPRAAVIPVVLSALSNPLNLEQSLQTYACFNQFTVRACKKGVGRIAKLATLYHL